VSSIDSGKLKGEGGHPVRGPGQAMAAVPAAKVIGTSDVEMRAVLGEQVNAFLRHASWELAVAAGRHRQQIIKLRRQGLDDSGELRVHYGTFWISPSARPALTTIR
jgi:hypothetical protein